MSFDDDRSERKRPTPPTGLEELDKRIELTLWVQNRISVLKRIQPSKMSESLGSELSHCLNSPNFETYEALFDRATQAKSEILIMTSQLEQKQSELEKRPTIEKIVRVPLEEVDPEPSLREMPEVPKPRFLRWIAIAILTLIIVVWYRYHNS